MMRSEAQRKAIFANLGSRKFQPIRAAHVATRSFARKHPFATEVAIGVPSFLAGSYLAARTKSFGPVARFLGRRGRITGGLLGFAAEIPGYAVADSAVRSATLGRKQQRVRSQAGLLTGFAGGIAAERLVSSGKTGVLLRAGRKLARPAIFAGANRLRSLLRGR